MFLRLCSLKNLLAESETGSFKSAVFCVRGIFKTANEKTLSVATIFWRNSIPTLTFFGN